MSVLIRRSYLRKIRQMGTYEGKGQIPMIFSSNGMSNMRLFTYVCHVDILWCRYEVCNVCTCTHTHSIVWIITQIHTCIHNASF